MAQKGYSGHPGDSSTPQTPSSSLNGPALEGIQGEAQKLLRGWPAATGLHGLGDVISHLPPLAPAPASFFPPSSTASLQSSNPGLVPLDPLFDQYSREISALMGGNVSGVSQGEVDRYRSQELQRLLRTREVREQVEGVGQGVQMGGSYGGLPPLAPPFPYSVSGPLPPLPTSTSFSSHFLQQTAFPLPPLPPISQIPSIPPFPPSQFPSTSIGSFVDEQLARAASAAAAAAASAQMQRSTSFGSRGGNPQTPSTSMNGGSGRVFTLPQPKQQPHLQQPIPTSSPDPLSLPYASGGPARPAINVTTGGVRYSQDQPLGRKRSSASLANSPTRSQGQNLDLVFPSPSRRKSSDKGKAKALSGTAGVAALQGAAAGGGGDETPRASQLGAPFSLPQQSAESATSVESGMKMFKLDLWARTAATPGTGASGGGKTSVVEKLDDLLSDIFSADDGFVLDTSSAAMGGSHSTIHRSPSRRAGTSASAEVKFFRTTAVSPSSNLPLIHTDTLKTLLRYFRTAVAKGKAEELVEAVEEGGIGRLLKLLERSWDGVDGWEGWENDAKEGRDVVEEDEGKRKKGKKGGKKASPAKGKKVVKGKGKKEAVEEDSDEDFDELESSPAKPSRRSSRTPSPSRSPSAVLPPSSPSKSSPPDSYWTSDRLLSTERELRTLDDALLAIRLALEILTLPLPPAHPLPKHLFSSDFLSSLISTLRKGALDACFLPLLEAVSTSPLSELAHGKVGGASTRERIGEITEGLHGAVDALSRLARREELGEDLVISLSYLSLESFFHDAPPPPSSSKAKAVEGPVVAAAKGLRMAALGLVQALYGRYAGQRQWLLEEVLGNVVKGDKAGGKGAKAKGAIRLRTGASVQTVSALLLHLVQTPPSNLHAQVHKKLAQAERVKAEDEVDENGDSQMSAAALREEMGMGRMEGVGEEEEEDDLADEDVLGSISRRLLDPAVESAQKAARTIVGFLFQRAAKAGKTAADSNDSGYRVVFDHLINDLLATLHLPEWPGAEVLLGVCCRSMMATLADPKSSHESNALKGLALEYLGSVASRIRSDLSLKAAGETSLGSFRDAVSSGDVDGLEKIFAAQKAVLEHLERAEKAGGISVDAAFFARIAFARELIAALEQAKAGIANFEPDELERSEGAQVAKAVVECLELPAKEVWEEGEGEDVFGPSLEDAQPRIDALALDMWRSSSLAAMYEPLLERIVEASESPQVTLRTKALRAISLVVATDPELFHQASIRRSIENRMLDASPAVRDASIELVGKYVINRPDLAVQYLPKLSERISDTGLSVRRRVVKLLKLLYHVVKEEEHQIDICKRLVYRVMDEDDGIKDLAVDTIEELWFGARGKATQEDKDVAPLAHVILKTTGVFKDRAPPVDEALRLIMAKHVEKGTTPPFDRVKEVMESLIDRLVEDDKEMDVVAAVKTIFTLSAVDAGLLSTAKATLLLPFLKSATSPDEQVITDYLLRIFRAAVLAMPKTSSKFGKDLQQALVPMLNRPSNNTLQEVVACFCAVVHGQTQDYSTMIRVFHLTIKRLGCEVQKLSKAETASSVNVRQLPVLCYMSSLLCEHGEFDRVREENEATRTQMDEITPNSVSENTYTLLVRLHSFPLDQAVKSTVLTSLGFIYRAHPTLMLHQSSTTIIDAIFSSPNPAMRLQVLRIIQDFLASQERASAAAAAQPTKKKKVEQGVKMEELVGNVEGFADLGVASAIAQRYLKRIINAALSRNPALSRLGIDLVGTIARSGFSHPITLSATLVALIASPDSQIASKAYSSLSLIHQKHASLLATRFLEPVRAAHSYTKAISGDEPVRGYRGDPPEALLGRWFSLLHREKRQVQLDFLKTLARSFELEAGAACSEDDLSFARFVAEMLSSFEYKRNEEVLMIISCLNSILAVSGLQVLHHLEQDLAGGGGILATASPSKLGAETDADELDKPPSPDLARQSVISGLALLLRDHLKHLYSMNDNKISKYIVGKKSPTGDRTVTRRSDAPLALGLGDYPSMPYALEPLHSEVELCEQRETYRSLVAQDGTLNALEEPEDDEA
ncbi:hypothetical protein JCM8547_008616 [Rhodosporidiobolus lusitaniae]